MVTARDVLIAAIAEQRPLVLILGQSACGGARAATLSWTRLSIG